MQLDQLKARYGLIPGTHYVADWHHPITVSSFLRGSTSWDYWCDWCLLVKLVLTLDPHGSDWTGFVLEKCPVTVNDFSDRSKTCIRSATTDSAPGSWKHTQREPSSGRCAAFTGWRVPVCPGSHIHSSSSRPDWALTQLKSLSLLSCLASSAGSNINIGATRSERPSAV